MAQAGSQTTAATTGKGIMLVLCAGAGFALAGPAGAVGGAATGSVFGGIIGSLAGGIAGNLATVFVDKFTNFFGGSMSRATANAPNHDLAALAAQSVFDAIGAAKGTIGTGHDFTNAVIRIHGATIEQIAATLAAVPEDAMDEETIRSVIGTPMGGSGTETKMPAFWLWVANDLADKTDARRIRPTGIKGVGVWATEAARAKMTPEASDPHAELAIKFVADYLHRHTANQVNDEVRGRTELGRRARIAAEFAYLRAILDAVKSKGEGSEVTDKQRDAIRGAVTAAFTDWDKQPKWFTDANTALVASIRADASATATTLTALGLDTAAIKAGIARIDSKLDAISEQVAEADDGSRARDGQTHKKLDEIKEAVGAKSAPIPTDNLAAASVPNNAAKFKGRTADLAALHRRVTTDASGLPIPIIAAPGLGKTAFVTRYVYLHQADFDHVWWVRAAGKAAPGSTTTLERSLAALLDLWGIESKAIQGDESTTRLDALAQRVCEWLARPKASATPARHLVVLDNVDESAALQRVMVRSPSRVIFTARAANLARDGAVPLRFDALTPADGVLVLGAKITQWKPELHQSALARLGELVGWNALALTYLAAVLSRFKTGLADPAKEILDPLEMALASALQRGDTAPIKHKQDHERPTDYAPSLEEAFAQFVAPFAGKAEMAVLDAAAFCEADNLPLTLLRDASGLGAEAFDDAAAELVGAGVLELDGDTVNIHRLTQASVRGDMARRNADAKPATLHRLLAALLALFNDVALHTKHPARTAAMPHAESVIAHSYRPAPAAGAGAYAARLRAEVALHLYVTGQLADATRHIDAAIAFGESQTQPNQRGLAIWYASRASIRQDRGDLAGAEADIKTSIDWEESQTPRHERGLAIWYASRASIRRDRGDLAGAEADIKTSIDWEESQTLPDQRELAIRYAARATFRRDRGDLARAEADIQKSIDWGEAQAPRNERGLAIDYASRARIRRERGDFAGAEADIQKSIDWGEAQSPRDERSLAILYAMRAGIRQDHGDLVGAEADIKTSIDWGEAQSPRNERGLAIDYAARAGIRRDRGDLAGAEADIKTSIDWGEAQSPRNERGLAIDYAARASIRQARGDLAGAEADIKTSIDWGEAQSPRDERCLAILYAARASIRQARGDLAGAEADIKKSIDYEESQTSRNERGLAILFASRASIRQTRGDLAGAEADLKKSIDWEEFQTQPNQRELAIRYASRARILRDCGDLAGAEADLKKSIDWFEVQSPRDERGLAIRYASRADIRRDRGDLAGAEADLKKSIDWAEAQSPRDERSLAIRYASRARIRQDRGDLAGAEADIKTSIDCFEAQSPRDERILAIYYASRARIRRDVAIEARASGDAAAATAGFKAARADIDTALAWWLDNLPADDRVISDMRRTKASIDAAEGK